MALVFPGQAAMTGCHPVSPVRLTSIPQAVDAPVGSLYYFNPSPPLPKAMCQEKEILPNALPR